MIALDLPPKIPLVRPAIIRPAEHKILRPGYLPATKAERKAALHDLIACGAITREQAQRAIVFFAPPALVGVSGGSTVPMVRSSLAGFNDTAAASNSVSFPSGAVTSDRLIIVYALQTNATADITHPAGYTVLLNNWATGASSGRLSVVYRDLQSGDSAPTFGVASSTWRAAWVAMCIKAGTFDPSASPSLSAATDSGASTNVQPASISVPGWSPYVSLLFVFGYWNHNIAVSSEPSGYSSVATGMGTLATGATAHIASNDQSVLGNYNATSGTPGPIVIASSSRCVSGTLVVKGA